MTSPPPRSDLPVRSARASIRRRFALTAGLAAIAVATVAGPAAAAQPEPPQIRAPGFLFPFQNWDYDENAGIRDNPVKIIFVSSRPDMVSRVYAQVAKVGMTRGGDDAIHLRGVGGSRPGVRATDAWKSNSAGRKGAFGCFGRCPKHTNIHIRTYGPDGQLGTQVYQGGFGLRPYYLVTTIHYDRDEHGPQRGFGWQDTARSVLTAKMTSLRLWRVLGSTPVRNACSGVRGTHHCQSDGRAAIISIDG